MRATRVSLLIDADRYFAAFRSAAIRARRSIFVLGWDIDTRTRLCGPHAPADGYPATLLEFFHALLGANEELEIYVLAWDFAVIYALERESFSSYRFQKDGHPRLHYVLDGNHPPGASHHQKVVVIDDEIGFVGGLDLTIRRWDTSDHLADHPLRVDPAGKPYPPFHDAQVAVQGAAARALGELARQRLARASDLTPPPVVPLSTEPLALPAAGTLDDVLVSIVRTQPAYLDGDEAVHEVRASTLHTIASARRLLYIENQYFTSSVVTDALIARLGEPAGPEVIMVLPKTQSGWLERNSMGVLRERALASLRAHDAHGRLHVYCALSQGECIAVHSKLMIADDRIMRVGSSNLSNRSLGLDTECDVVIDAAAPGQDEARVRTAISVMLQRLLAEHLGCRGAQVAALTANPRSLIALIESQKRGPRQLAKLEPQREAASGLAGIEDVLADPERPVALDDFVRELLPTRRERFLSRSTLALLALLLPLVLLAAVWRSDVVQSVATPEVLGRTLRLLRDSPFGPLLVCGCFVVATQLFCPVTVLIAATALAFEPAAGFGVAFFSCVLAAAASYGIGRVLAERMPRRFASTPRMRMIRQQLKLRGFHATVAARLLPVGNFTVINLLAGVVHVPFWAFVAGNAVGLVPGLLGLMLMTRTLGATLTTPSFSSWLSFVLCVISMLAVLYASSKLFSRFTDIWREGKLRTVGKWR